MKPNEETPHAARASAPAGGASAQSELPWDAELDVEIIDGEFVPRRHRRDE